MTGEGSIWALLRALPALRPARIAGLLGLSFAAAVSEGIGLLLLVPLLDVLAGGQSSSEWPALVPVALSSRLTVPIMLGVFVGLVVLRSLLVFGHSRAVLRLELEVVNGLRQHTWDALLAADWRYLATLRRSQQASLLISNLDRAGLGIRYLCATGATTTTLAVLGLAALAIDWRFALGGLVGGALALACFGILRQHTNRLGDAANLAWDRVHGEIDNAMKVLRAIKMDGAESANADRLTTTFADVARLRLRFHHRAAGGQAVLQSAAALVLAGLVWVAIDPWQMPMVVLLPMVALFARAVPLLGALVESWQHWNWARPALVATARTVGQAHLAREVATPVTDAPRVTAELALREVTLRYPGQEQPALSEVTFAIPAGTITAIAGPSGAGKSTLADVLAGLLEPDAGDMAVDGTPLDPAGRLAWRRSLAYVEQEPVLRAATLRDNLLGPQIAADDAAIWEALDQANLTALATGLPDGLDTPLGDGGRALSGGERQRLMLARALLRRPQVLILDEATSALDPANEGAIAEVLSRLRGRVTIIVISHRGSLLALADRIITLKNGRLVEEFPA